MYVHLFIYTIIFYIWILMFWRGMFKGAFAKNTNWNLVVWELFLCIHSCEYKLWYLDLMIARETSKIQIRPLPLPDFEC